ncbi:putative cellulase [Dioszegia hungarica]|uniref:glucan 1,3-beta-glucosidase n=1 Tax=Dioszegia hungarica TaxID=4972 RepID=A0AA38HAQ3_9TREE|nr:putative cellulase [Dioszegia hungarica]KAI9637448.1 putative cellulase [Dioszegia hungarica]
MRTSTLLTLLSSLLPIAIQQVAAAPLAERGVNVGWPYGSQKIRGVNLGGWLLLEPWITPSLFRATNNDGIVDEYTFCQYQDRGVASAALKNHWETFIVENDIKWLSEAGLNHIRIPIGFWAYDVSGGEPYIQGAAEYLDRAIGWARKYNVKVILDLHGAPGSQNGFDNSGVRGAANWATNSNNVYRAKKVVETLSRKYSDPYYWQVVTMLALLNEPATFQNDQLLQTTRQYWYDAYGAARYPWVPEGSASKSGLALVISDGFQPLNTFNGFMTEPNFESVFIDTHNYQVFNDDYQTWDQNRHIRGICDRAKTYAQSPLWLMVGEWSLASTDCAFWLNGRGIGARYDGTYPYSPRVGSCQGKSGKGGDFSQDYKNFLRRFWDVQTQSYEANGQGWVFWTWKTEEAAEWSYQTGLINGWIPYNPNEHLTSYQQVCN